MKKWLATNQNVQNDLIVKKLKINGTVSVDRVIVDSVIHCMLEH